MLLVPQIFFLLFDRLHTYGMRNMLISFFYQRFAPTAHQSYKTFTLKNKFEIDPLWLADEIRNPPSLPFTSKK